MKTDEFAFLNQQLAAMLRSGIPLEGALQQLCAGMKSGPLRAELEALERDLAGGTPLPDALGRRDLPEFYKRMVELGARGNDLPGMLTLLADHYHRAHATWTRLKGLMIYPALVLVTALGLTALLAWLSSRLAYEELLPNAPIVTTLDTREGRLVPIVAVWVPPVVLALAGVGLAVVLAARPARAWLRWRLPAFREASLAQLASSLVLLLRGGATLADALAFAAAVERDTPAGAALAVWRREVESGRGKPSEWPALKPFPPLFLWLVQQGGEDVAAGFAKAAEIFQSRANYRIEIALYGALPVSVLLLGQMVLWQLIPVAQSVARALPLFSSPF
ncbi:MAG: type II secretion system F family protein [Verrucomicrobiales bacterium]|nr:type II secretion system F family protein [Verrucomicrobiales bacterium]